MWGQTPPRVGWPKIGYPRTAAALIPAPAFGTLILRVNGVRVDLAKQRPTNYELAFDLHQGLLVRRCTLTLNGATVRFEFRRFFSLVIPQAALFAVRLTVLAGKADIVAVALLDATTKPWTPQHIDTAGCIQLTTAPLADSGPRFTATFAQQWRRDSQVAAGQKLSTSQLLQETVAFSLTSGESTTLEKDVVAVTSRDVPKEAQGKRAKQLIEQVSEQSFAAHLAAHEALWKKRWARADVQIEGAPATQQGLRFSTFQLMSTFFGEDPRLNIGPKGFSGSKYAGATYWDSEVALLPFYLGVAPPAVARGLLKYRLGQLPQAEASARLLGLAGALYPVATFDGSETHSEWEITLEEIHRNSAVVWAIAAEAAWSGDDSYARGEGLAVLVDIARFWAARVDFDRAADQYVLRGVTGPNEYDNNVDNDWYTNDMARWTLAYANQMVGQAGASASMPKTEVAHWQGVAAKMKLARRPDGVFIANDTFLAKPLVPAAAVPPTERPLNQHWSWDRILRAGYLKQADVLQAMVLLPNDFTDAEVAANFAFYAPLTVHESSLSPAVHAILAARVGRLAQARELLDLTVRQDLDDLNDEGDEGLHVSAMGGGWLAVAHGLAGMRLHTGQLTFRPVLPPGWNGYAFRVQFRGRQLAVTVGAQTRVTLLQGPPLTIAVNGQSVRLQS